LKLAGTLALAVTAILSWSWSLQVMLENDDALQIVRADLANLVARAGRESSCDIEVFTFHKTMCT
jgi:hypothetical protein